MDKFQTTQLRRQHLIEQLSAHIRDNPGDVESKKILKSLKAFNATSLKIEKYLKEIDSQLDILHSELELEDDEEE